MAAELRRHHALSRRTLRLRFCDYMCTRGCGGVNMCNLCSNMFYAHMGKMCGKESDRGGNGGIMRGLRVFDYVYKAVYT